MKDTIGQDEVKGRVGINLYCILNGKLSIR